MSASAEVRCAIQAHIPARVFWVRCGSSSPHFSGLRYSIGFSPTLFIFLRIGGARGLLAVVLAFGKALERKRDRLGGELRPAAGAPAHMILKRPYSSRCSGWSWRKCAPRVSRRSRADAATTRETSMRFRRSSDVVYIML